MKGWIYIALLLVTVAGLSGCANRERLGRSVAEVRAEQTYNPNATTENMGFIPTGNGERMEAAYDAYTGKESQGKSGSSKSKSGVKKASDSQVLSNAGW
ncbi:hypothetical protein [Vibrio mangrovi]|uniref:Lipoprotein n=1 Tax=Vibrio mangrovi TaxID=474394 RepID=A0A1Y6IYM9_9VIBR|nr:hypothetical protein [Vibrio mangrovi]MDW6002353.1 hypothetical protein [Vibrio mangrovi]SMS02748.1 hypothetical protein VIM7927_04088 [Vibrio mangrovi]